MAASSSKNTNSQNGLAHMKSSSTSTSSAFLAYNFIRFHRDGKRRRNSESCLIASEALSQAMPFYQLRSLSERYQKPVSSTIIGSQNDVSKPLQTKENHYKINRVRERLQELLCRFSQLEEMVLSTMRVSHTLIFSTRQLSGLSSALRMNKEARPPSMHTCGVHKMHRSVTMDRNVFQK